MNNMEYNKNMLHCKGKSIKLIDVTYQIPYNVPHSYYTPYYSLQT